MRRNYRFDNIKLILILFVIVAHFFELFKGEERAYLTIYTFHMPLFICISGFVIAYSFNNKLAKSNNIRLSDVFNFIYRKFLAIMIPYYAWSLIISPFFFYSFDGTLLYTKILKTVPNHLQVMALKSRLPKVCVNLPVKKPADRMDIMVSAPIPAQTTVSKSRGILRTPSEI